MSELPLFFHFSNIPAATDEAFEIHIDGEPVYFTEKSIPQKNHKHEQVKIPAFKGNGDHVIDLNIKIPMRNIDHVQKCNITKSGEYFSIGLDEEKKSMNIKQQHDPFEFIPKDQTIVGNKYTLRKLNVPKEFDDVFFYLYNIPATREKPFQLFIVEKKRNLIYEQKTSRYNKTATLSVKLPQPKQEITIDILLHSFGKEYKAQKTLDLNHGQHIRISFYQQSLKVEQRRVNHFEKIPYEEVVLQDGETFEDLKKDTEAHQDPEAEVSIALFYLVNIQASQSKKFRMKIDNMPFHKIEKEVERPVLGIKGEFPKPETGDHVIEVSIECPAQGIHEPVKKKLNLTKDGIFVKIEIVKGKDENIVTFEQQHEEYKFSGEGSYINDVKLNEIVTSTVEIEESDDELPEPQPEKEEKNGSQEEDDDIVQRLEALAQLRDEGMISEKEYQEKKAKLLELN